MKRIILSIAVIMASVCFMSVNAQTTTSFGIKANGILTNVKLSDYQTSNGSFRPGVALGGFVNVNFNEYFSLQPELELSYTTGKIRVGDVRNKYKYASVEIPVYAMGRVKAGNGSFFAGVGPNIGYGFSADSKTEKLPQGAPGENKLELDHWYAGGGILAGYEFNNGIMINAGYKMSWDLGSDNVKTQTISLGIGYRF